MALSKWEFDTVHSHIAFAVRHMVVSKVRGQFTRWSGAVHFDEKSPGASSVEAEIDMTSVDTHDAQRDAHLRSPDFFDTDKFPRMTFKSTKVEPAEDGTLRVTGDLTLHGVTRPVTLEVDYGGRMVDPRGYDRLGFSARTTIDRKEFGVTFNIALDQGGLALSEKVEVTLDVEAVRPRATESAQAVSP